MLNIGIMWHAFDSDRSRFKRLCVSVYASARVCVYMCACGEMAHLVFREPHSSHLIELGEAVGEILQPGMSKVDKSRLVHRNNIKNRSNAFRLQNRNKHPS